MNKVIAEKWAHIGGPIAMRCICGHTSFEDEEEMQGKTTHQCHACREIYEVEIPWLEPPKPRKPRLGRLIGGVPIQ